MPVIPVENYHGGYFHKAAFAEQIRGGYGCYRRWSSTDDSRMTDGRTSSGEFWRDKAIEAANQWLLPNQNVLEIGCAFGFIVEDLVDLGYDAYGLDVSDYAINTCPGGTDPRGQVYQAAAKVRRPDLAGRFHLGDARTALAQFRRNEFDVVVSLRVMECFADADLPGLIDELNRICKTVQVHVIDEFSGDNSVAAQDYNAKPIGDWLAMGWDTGTRLIVNERPGEVLVK